MKTEIIGDILVVTSDIKAEELNKAEAYAGTPKLVDDKGNEIFAVYTGPQGAIGKHGIVFNGTNADGNLFVSVQLPGPIPNKSEEKLEAVKRNYWQSLDKLRQLTNGIPQAVTSLNETLDQIFAETEVR